MSYYSICNNKLKLTLSNFKIMIKNFDIRINVNVINKKYLVMFY